MNLYTPSRTALLLIAAVSFNGCALKPKAKSRFEHPTRSNGACRCYTCQQTAAAPPVTKATPVAGATPTLAPAAISASTLPPQANCESCQSEAPQINEGGIYSTEISTAPVSNPSPTIFPSPMIDPAFVEPFPNAQDNRVDSLNASDPGMITDEAPVIEEISPSSSSSASGFETDAELLGGWGGEFKSDLESDSRDDVLISASDQEPTLAQRIDEPAPAAAPAPVDNLEVAPVVKEPVPVAPMEATKPTEELAGRLLVDPVEGGAEIPKPVKVPEIIDVPQPASHFEAGQPFRPRKARGNPTVSPTDSTWNDLDTNFYQHGADEDSKSSAEIVAKPKRLSRQRVVLQANKVEQNVVYSPLARKPSVVAVTPLPATFRRSDDSDNSLRSMDHSSIASVPEKTPLSYEVTDVSDDEPFFVPVPAPATEQVVKAPVRLKAIPLNRLVAVIEPHNVDQNVVAQPVSSTIRLKSDSVPSTVKEEVAEATIRVAEISTRAPQRTSTSAATQKKAFVLPPWRIK